MTGLSDRGLPVTGVAAAAVFMGVIITVDGCEDIGRNRSLMEVRKLPVHKCTAIMHPASCCVQVKPVKTRAHLSKTCAPSSVGSSRASIVVSRDGCGTSGPSPCNTASISSV